MHAEHLSYQTDKGRELQEMTKLLRALGATEEQILETIMAYCKGESNSNFARDLKLFLDRHDRQS